MGSLIHDDSISPESIGNWSFTGSSESPPDGSAAYSLSLPLFEDESVLAAQSRDTDQPSEVIEAQVQAPAPAPAPAPAVDLAPDPTEKPYHSKRPHKKSRTGCKNCKARKVKCDEGRPTCRSCKQRNVPCIYVNVAAASTATTTNNSTATATSTSTATSSPKSNFEAGIEPSSTFVLPSRTQNLPSPVSSTQSQFSPVPIPNGDGGALVIKEPVFCPASIDEEDLRLLWFYTAATSSSFTVDAGAPARSSDILKVRLVQVAFETPFLMDSLLALSSMHLQVLNQPYDVDRAISYRLRSFAGYRKAIEEARPETFSALVGNSLLMTALSSQQFRDKDSKELYIIDWMIVWRGIGLIIHRIGISKFFHSGLAELFRRPSIDLESCLSAIPSHLLFMVSSIKPDDPDYAEVETLYSALKYLGSLYAYLQVGIKPTMGLRIITWFTFLPKEFIEMVRQRRPRALVIIAHYAVFLKLIQTVWWMEGVGDRSLSDLCEYLGPEWQYLLIVPQMARRTNSVVEIGRIVLENRDWQPPESDEDPIDWEGPMNWVDDAGRRTQFLPKEGRLIILEGVEDELPLNNKI